MPLWSLCLSFPVGMSVPFTELSPETQSVNPLTGSYGHIVTEIGHRTMSGCFLWGIPLGWWQLLTQGVLLGILANVSETHSSILALLGSWEGRPGFHGQDIWLRKSSPHRWGPRGGLSNLTGVLPLNPRRCLIPKEVGSLFGKTWPRHSLLPTQDLQCPLNWETNCS